MHLIPVIGLLGFSGIILAVSTGAGAGALVPALETGGKTLVSNLAPRLTDLSPPRISVPEYSRER